MFYYLYQITNLVNAKIYVGVHKTRNMNDGYMGSGKVILRAIEKHGTNNFKKDILETFQNETEMYAREKEVVTEDFLSRKDVYNLRRGGHGGFDWINKKGLAVSIKNQQARDPGLLEKIKHNSRIGYSKFMKNASAEWIKERAKKGGIASQKNGCPFSELNYSQEFQELRKAKFKEIGHQQGATNSQFGTRWITDGTVNKKIPKNSDIPLGFIPGRSRT